MSRVKFNVNTEYAYIQNFKILQSMLSHGAALFSHVLQVFRRSKADRTGPFQQTASRNTGLIDPSMSNRSSSARCKTTSSSCNGRSGTGINNTRAMITTRSRGERDPVRLPLPLPLHAHQGEVRRDEA
jgi:hypothetical protein